MHPLSQISILESFILFFITLGPLKIIAPFAQLSRGADPALRRNVAWRATTISTAVVVGVALLGVAILKNWDVSIPAIVISGGIILFYQALQLILQPSVATPPHPLPQTGQSQLSLDHSAFPIAIPAIVTAPGIAVIAALMALAKDNPVQEGLLIGVLLAVMALNLITLLNIDFILKHSSPSVQQVIGWVLAVLQAALAAQYIINGFIRLGALPSLAS